MDSIWKSKVSSDDNFLLDFNLPWRFTIFIQPTGKQKSLSSLRREIFPEKTQMDTYNPSTRGWCLSPAGLHEWRLSAGYLQHKCSRIKLQKATIFTTYFSYTKTCELLRLKRMDVSCRAHTVYTGSRVFWHRCGHQAQQSWLLSGLRLVRALFIHYCKYIWSQESCLVDTVLANFWF